MAGELIIRGTKTKNGMARCVWERRMKCDQVKGGIKLFKGEEDQICNDSLLSNEEVQVDKIENLSMMSPKQKVVVGTNGGKRKTWKSESLEGSPIQLARQRSEMGKNLEEKSPIQNRKTRSESMKELSASLEVLEKSKVLEKSPIQNKKTRSETNDVADKTSIQLRYGNTKSPELTNSKSESIKDLENAPQLMKAKSQSSKLLYEENGESCNELSNGVDEKIDKGIAGIKNCKEFGVSEEKVTSNVLQIKSIDEEFEEVEEDKGIEDLEIEKKSLGVKEFTNVAAEQKAKKIIAEEKKFQTIPSIVKKNTPPFVCHTKVHLPSPSKTNPSSDESQRIPRKHTKLQSSIDLVMWRDVSKSAFVFGIGAFSIISSSYTKDLNISFISVISYLGLVYLAAIFLFRSFISRGSEMNDSSMDYVFGEEEAVWLVKSTLPYVNECFLNLKALFSGDPATTMKMAVMLFVLARCGSSITIWKMAKLGFFGVFTVPKICSSYSTQLTEYGISWIGRFRDAWEWCTHKKVVAFAIFTLVWKLSSSIVRIWAVFMLFVAFRCYQQSIYTGEGWMKEEPRFQDSSQTSRVGPSPSPSPAQRQPRRPILVETGKQKRIY